MPTYEYPRPALTVDILVLSPGASGSGELLLIRRKYEPFQHQLCFPGGFVDLDETCVQAAQRELQEETGVSVRIDQLQPIGLFDGVDRDPRDRVVSFAYHCVITPEAASQAQAGDDAARLEWVPLEDVLNLKLGFDHNLILATYLQLRSSQNNGKS